MTTRNSTQDQNIQPQAFIVSIYMGGSRRAPGGQIKESQSPMEFI